MLNRGDQWQIAYIILERRISGPARAGNRGAADRSSPRPRRRWPTARTRWRTGDRSRCSRSPRIRLTRWSKPGLLLIGDAAHVMSPVGGVGINYAIQDAIVTANTLYEPLRQGHVTEVDLARIQREREFPTRLIQAIQSQIQERALLPLTHESGQLHVPGWLQMALRLPGVSGLPPYVMGIGFRPAKLRPELIAEEPIERASQTPDRARLAVERRRPCAILSGFDSPHWKDHSIDHTQEPGSRQTHGARYGRFSSIPAPGENHVSPSRDDAAFCCEGAAS